MYCVLYETFPTIMCRESEWKLVVLHWDAVVSMFSHLNFFWSTLGSRDGRVLSQNFCWLMVTWWSYRVKGFHIRSCILHTQKKYFPLPSLGTSENYINDWAALLFLLYFFFFSFDCYWKHVRKQEPALVVVLCLCAAELLANVWPQSAL